MQDQIREIIQQINKIIAWAPHASLDRTLSDMRTVVNRLDDLTVEYPELRRYELTVSRRGIPDDIRVVETVLPVMFADLMIAAKSKPGSERSARERAALELLVMVVEEIYEPMLRSEMPRITQRSISIRAVEPDD